MERAGADNARSGDARRGASTFCYAYGPYTRKTTLQYMINERTNARSRHRYLTFDLTLESSLETC